MFSRFESVRQRLVFLRLQSTIEHLWLSLIVTLILVIALLTYKINHSDRFFQISFQAVLLVVILQWILLDSFKSYTIRTWNTQSIICPHPIKSKYLCDDIHKLVLSSIGLKLHGGQLQFSSRLFFLVQVTTCSKLL